MDAAEAGKVVARAGVAADRDAEVKAAVKAEGKLVLRQQDRDVAHPALLQGRRRLPVRKERDSKTRR